MKQPLLHGDEFLADVRNADPSEDRFHIWWLGQSGYLLKWGARHVLLDPYLSDSLTRKYAATDKPHVRMTERVIEPERLAFVDIVTSSHNHTDHLDPDTLRPLFAANPALAFVLPEANRAMCAERAAIDAERPIGLDDGEAATVGDFRFTGIAAAHETLDRDSAGRCIYLGYLVTFGPWTIYHSGDTVLYEGMDDRLTGRSIDLALLPVNGSRPERRVAGNLNGSEAAELAKRTGMKLVIPCHYDMFEFNTVTTEEFELKAAAIRQPYKILRNGEGFTIHA